MDRNEGIIRWSPNPTRDEFLSINLNYRIIQIYQATQYAHPGQFDYQKISKHNEFPPLSSYDWSPTIPGLIALGTARGEVNLLRVDDDSNDFITLPLKLQRPCQAVAFNTTGLLAVGLDRVRNDSCLQIWDINQRLAGWDSKEPGWRTVLPMSLEPKKLEASVSVSSIRFFEDQPQTLVVGVKNQSVRIHDLRDPNSSVISFPTRCNNNLAIDYADSNYFASSSLDHPGLMVWDRRATGRSTASTVYLESIDQEEVPWGAALKLDRAIETEKNLYIRQLRYCRDQRGMLGVLSGAGQLQVFRTTKEFVDSESVDITRGGPELLEVKRSYDLEYHYFDPDHKKPFEDRIVSFDWLTMGNSEIPGRVVALRANGCFDILQTPAATTGLLSNMIPWKPPHRLGDPYLNIIDLKDPKEREIVLGPLFATEIKGALPVFGHEKLTSRNNKLDVDVAVKKLLRSARGTVVNLLAPSPSSQCHTSSNAALELPIKLPADGQSGLDDGNYSSSTSMHSSRELHEQLYNSISGGSEALATQSGGQLDSLLLRRAKDGYLFDCKRNKRIVHDDHWLQDVWDWIDGAKDAASHDGMVSGHLDLSYMGVYTIWTNSLGEKSQTRLIGNTILPDATQWEQLIASINKHAGRLIFKGADTAKPQHRQLCLAICGLAKPLPEFDRNLKELEDVGKHTTAAAWALFEGIPKRAVEILKKGGSDLLFIAMALDIKLNSDSSLNINTEEWRTALRGHPQMANDPYLRSIYGFITSGNWAAIADETALPLRDRVGVALRNFDDVQLTTWLSKQMDQAIRTGDIEGIVLSGITNEMADILAKYVEKFLDFQTPILIMSFCYPRYIDDARCDSWRKAYKDFLQRHKEHILRVMFEQNSSIKSRSREGIPVVRAPPRQVTIRCLKCDAVTANDLVNSGAAPTSAPVPSKIISDDRNPLAASGANAGLCCPKCGSHLMRCAVCMEIVGVPRSDRPEQSNDQTIRRMANFPTFCMRCKHVTHMDHSVAWFGRHVECPVPECQCQCNEKSTRQDQTGPQAD